MRYLGLAVATSLGVGYVPFAPGTFGSLAGLLLWWLLPHTPVVQLVAIVVLFAAGSWSGNIAERHFGETDPGPVVIDEVMGMLITLFLAGIGMGGIVSGTERILTQLLAPVDAQHLSREALSMLIPFIVYFNPYTWWRFARDPLLKRDRRAHV